MDVLDLARRVADELRPMAAIVDKSGRFPKDNLELLKKRGYLNIAVPTELGGGGADLETVCRAQAIVGGACASTALAANMHIFGIGSAAEGWAAGDRTDEEFFKATVQGLVVAGSVADTIAGARSSTATATPVDGGYRVSGRKHFVSLAPVLDQFMCSASVAGHPGALVLFSVPRDTEGLSFVDTWDVMGMRGTGSWDAVLDDVFAPASAAALSLSSGGWSSTSSRNSAWFSFTVASVYLGLARAAAAFTYDYVGKRTEGGSTQPKSHQPASVFGAGEIELLLRPAEALLRDGCRRRREGEVLALDEIATVKHIAVTAAADAVDRCLRMVGGHGLFKTLPLERFYRDVRAGQFHPLGPDQTLEVVGKRALGLADVEPRWPAD